MSTPVVLRRLSKKEGQALLRAVRRSPDPVARKRAACLLALASGESLVRLARTGIASASYARKIVHAFHAEGLASLGAHWGRGRPRTFDDTIQQQIVDVVRTPPHQAGLPFSVWSLPKLRAHLMARKMVSTISVSTLHRLLCEAGMSLQRTKTWKQSTDKNYARKKSKSSSVTRRRAAG